MDQDLFITIFWVVVIIFIYKKIKADNRWRQTHPKTKDLNIKKRVNNLTSVNSDSNSGWSTETTNGELHGHRCYLDELTSYEYALVKHLAENLSSEDYYIFNNITVPSSYTITAQIDHVLVSRYGIFVIENKDFSGWVFGQKNQKRWTQVIKGGKKFHFQNPILQNFAHISALKEHMPFLSKCFYSAVVFSNKSKFKTDMPANVMHGEDLVEYILSKKREVVKEGELLMTIGKLSILCQTSQALKEEHVENLLTVHPIS